MRSPSSSLPPLEDVEEVGEEEAVAPILEIEWRRMKAVDAQLIESKARAACAAALAHNLDRRVEMMLPRQPQPASSWLDRVFEEMKSNDKRIQLLGRRGKRGQDDHEPRLLLLSQDNRSLRVSTSPCQQPRGKRRCTWSVDELDVALQAFDLHQNSCTTLAAWCPPVSVPPGTTARLVRHAARQASRRSSKACRSQRRTPLAVSMGDLDTLFCRLDTA